ncbi:biotin-dependent carboxyltransferase family protein [Neobacillus sp. PS3-40]|uniref:5-oxoprolinase subunit C family protein n=1 Tax=Neobacillus sp. PS3-40 TaxID=3070679 RepID=UPI0027E04776|nr:biotin-dependent carboxyltransferase family protein [Neobacillus sp. PS3-40]WML43956.1 biotin-dependent carboxyltransferase family protein [Neobacillus sp. PS3-40]
MSIKVIRPGMLSTVQDLGRYGMQKYGVIVSGAMDSFALRVANILVGNTEGEAALEITMIGSKLEFRENLLIAICGGNLSPTIDGHIIPQWRPVLVKKGCILSFGAVKSGCRVYLAISGGFDIPKIMDSQSTYLRAGIGGFHGRSLKEGDVLLVKAPSDLAVRRISCLFDRAGTNEVAASEWSVSQKIFPAYTLNPIIRAVRGGQFNWFTIESRKQFFEEEFLVTPQSDRMGYRLCGQQLQLSEPRELISEAVTAGTVQVPSGGNPIVLLADRQTIGGYPKIAQVATVDLPILAQVKPGDKVRFQEIQLEEAQELLQSRETVFQLLKQGVKLKESSFLGGFHCIELT